MGKSVTEILFELTDQSAWDVVGVTQGQYDELSKQLRVDRAEAKKELATLLERALVELVGEDGIDDVNKITHDGRVPRYMNGDDAWGDEYASTVAYNVTKLNRLRAEQRKRIPEVVKEIMG